MMNMKESKSVCVCVCEREIKKEKYWMSFSDELNLIDTDASGTVVSFGCSTFSKDNKPMSTTKVEGSAAEDERISSTGSTTAARLSWNIEENHDKITRVKSWNVASMSVFTRTWSKFPGDCP